MFTEKYEKYLVLTKEKSTSKIVGAINEVLRVRMLIITPRDIYIILYRKSFCNRIRKNEYRTPCVQVTLMLNSSRSLAF